MDGMFDRRRRRVNAKLVFLFSLLMLFLENMSFFGAGEGREGGRKGGLFHYGYKQSADYCRYDFVLKNTVISESVRTCSRA